MWVEQKTHQGIALNDKDCVMWCTSIFFTNNSLFYARAIENRMQTVVIIIWVLVRDKLLLEHLKGFTKQGSSGLEHAHGFRQMLCPCMED